MTEEDAVKAVAGFRQRHCAEVVAFMAKGYSLTAFAGEIGVSRATLDRWCGAHATFAAAVDRAQAARARRLEDELLRARGSGSASHRLQALKSAAPDEWPTPGGRAVQSRGKPQRPTAVALPDNGRQ